MEGSLQVDAGEQAAEKLRGPPRVAGERPSCLILPALLSEQQVSRSGGGGGVG